MFDDTDFSVARLEAAYDADLAHGLGNLASRLTTLCESAGVPGRLCTETPVAPLGFHEAVTAFRFDYALGALWNEIAALNREIGDARPWDDVAAGRLDAARERLSGWAERLYATAFWLTSFLPSTGTAVRDALSQSPIRKCWPLFPRRRR